MVAQSAAAEPRFAVREGMRCAHCHVNRTGGGMRTPFGVSFAQTGLPTFRMPAPFDPALGASVAIGANLRLSHLTTMPAQTSIADTVRTSDASNSFDMTEGNLYIRADIVPDRLTIYIDETIAPEGASAREAFVLVSGPMGSYIKAGRFLLPFGLRIPDDDAFIRRETGFTYANQDLGVELGIAPHPFSLSVAVTNGSLGGSDPDPFKQVTASADVVWSWGRAGLSFAYNDTSSDDFDLQTIAGGAHVGMRLGRLIALAELDWVHGSGSGETWDQWMLYAAADFEVLKGLYLQFDFQANDPLLSMKNNERDRFSVGVSWFPIQLLEIRARYRINRDIPQRVSGNADDLLIEVHGVL